MQPCSSPSIGQLAGALAQAQVELTNPAKILTATLPRGSAGGGGQTYRDAPLSAGLDIIRKALGGQEIAVLQTTHVDQGHGAAEGGMLVLTTTLAHSSGEWVSTTWPVCRLGDVSDPKLLGAALTYARRYSLFALVGITGDDDLDAPELRGEEARRHRSAGEEALPSSHTKPEPAQYRAGASRPLSRVRGRVAGATQAKAPSPAAGGDHASAARPISTSDLSARLEAVLDEEALLRWAKDILPVRSRLAELDRVAMDQAFLERAKAIGADPEFLSAFSRSGQETSSEPLPLSSPTIPSAGGFDAQAPL